MKLRFWNRHRVCTSIGTLASLLLSAHGAGAFTAGQNNYTTNFPLAENPISENGNWINGEVAGLDWSNAQTYSGFAYGTQPGDSYGASVYNDSIAILSGTWAPDQIASATISINQPDSGSGLFEEVELHLRATISADLCTGYEINASVISGNPYMQVVRWDGPLGAFTELAGQVISVNDGDTISASIIGSTITVYLNGNAQFSVSDSTYSSGNPGIGFFLQGATGLNADYGFSSFSATDMGLGNPEPTPSPTVTPTDSPSPTDTSTPTSSPRYHHHWYDN